MRKCIFYAQRAGSIRQAYLSEAGVFRGRDIMLRVLRLGI